MEEIPRLSRLISLLTILQSKRLITATEIAQKFDISIRTAYRDIKALEQAGIPIYTQEGKGYSLVNGYSLPPVMFTETEANALITAEKLVNTNKDTSLTKAYSDAIVKIKAIMRYSGKDKAELLSDRVLFRSNLENHRTSAYLSELQLTITNSQRCHITYQRMSDQLCTSRDIEPFALYNTNQNWVLVAFCLLRKEYRAFRLDHILSLQTLEEHFTPSKMTLQDYFDNCSKKRNDDP